MWNAWRQTQLMTYNIGKEGIIMLRSALGVRARDPAVDPRNLVALLRATSEYVLRRVSRCHTPQGKYFAFGVNTQRRSDTVELY